MSTNALQIEDAAVSSIIEGFNSTDVLKRFRLVFKAVQQHSHYVERSCGVSTAQLWAISLLAGQPGMKVSELARSMSIHQSTASNLLDKLVKKNLVLRARISEDQRVVSLFLTETGKELLLAAPQPHQGVLQHAIFTMSDETLANLAGALDALIAGMNIDLDESAALQPLDTKGT